MKNDIVLIFRLLDREARRQIFLLWGISIFVPIFEALGVGLIFPFIKLIMDPAWISEISWASEVISILGEPSHRTIILYFGLGMIAIFLVKNVYLMSVICFQYFVSSENISRYSTILLRRYMLAPYTVHLQRNSAEMTRLARELPQILFSGVLALIGLASEMLILLLLSAILMLTEPMATMLAAALAMGGTGFFYVLAGAALRRWGRQRMLVDVETQQALQQALMGVKDIRVLGRESYFIGLFARKIGDYAALLRRVQTVNQLPRQAFELVTMICMVGVVMFMTLNGTSSVDLLPKLAIFAVAAFRLMPSLNRINQGLGELKSVSAPLEVLYRDMFAENLSPAGEGGRERPRLHHSLELDQVTFHYPDSSAPALEHINISIGRGETIGLVGPSGSGKSTLVDLILGLLMPDQGEIRVDGIALERFGGWHGAVGYVPQSIYITDDTIRRNIAFGIDDEEIEDEAVHSALTMAHLDDLIAGLPDGLDTRLAEDGVRLSGGQRQRIGIARALYHDPDLLVLDEATSALDPVTEREISAAVEALQGSKTVIIIAHRLSTVRHCDRLFLIEGGRISDSGRFDDLAERSASFQGLVQALSMEVPTDSNQTAELAS